MGKVKDGTGRDTKLVRVLVHRYLVYFVVHLASLLSSIKGIKADLDGVLLRREDERQDGVVRHGGREQVLPRHVGALQRHERHRQRDLGGADGRGARHAHWLRTRTKV